jgi:hypothetical protein
MMRKKRTVLFASRLWSLQSLFPADFLTEKFWPFAFYRLPEDVKPVNHEPKRDWKLKPTNMTEHETALKSAIKRALGIGANLKSGEFGQIEGNEELKMLLLSEIYALSYDLTPAQKLICPYETINRDQAEMIYFKAKMYTCEPFALIANLQDESPELYNSRRYDFNLFVLGCGWDRERREIEKAQQEMKAKYPARKR